MAVLTAARPDPDADLEALVVARIPADVVEWARRAESLGAEVVSSSLGYTDWYTFKDMDGKTAVTTRAANRAIALGVVVVNTALLRVLIPTTAVGLALYSARNTKDHPRGFSVSPGIFMKFGHRVRTRSPSTSCGSRRSTSP